MVLKYKLDKDIGELENTLNQIRESKDQQMSDKLLRI